MYFKQKNNLTTGFTLVESLVAISIFTLTLLVMMAALGKSLSDTISTKQKMTAEYLAQEGIEYMRNLRDTYMLYDSGGPQTGWDNFRSRLATANCNILSAGCYFDDQNIDYTSANMPMIALSILPCNDTTCSANPLWYNSGKYGYVSSGGVNSGFTRKIVLDTNDSNTAKIYSYVYWAQGSGTYNISFSETLFKWTE